MTTHSCVNNKTTQQSCLGNKKTLHIKYKIAIHYTLMNARIYGGLPQENILPALLLPCT